MSDNTARLILDSETDFSSTASDIKQHFEDVITFNSLLAIFQPIVEFNTQLIFGYESLVRGPSDSPLHSPVALFDTAKKLGRVTELDLLCRQAGIKAFKQHQLNGKLFLNTTPQGLFDPNHKTGLTLEYLNTLGVDPKNVVIELTEQYPMTDFKVMSTALAHYRSMGFEIAIDDLGAGYSGLRRWSELRPEFVKIDRHFIQGIHTNEVKQSFVKSIVDIAAGLNCKVIAEGIETREEYIILLELGIKLGQGYYFSRPQPVPPHTLSNLLFHQTSPSPRHRRPSNVSEGIGDLLTPAPFLPQNSVLEDAYQLFVNDEKLTAIAIVGNDLKCLGLIRRSRILTTFSTQYGRSLHGGKSVCQFMDEFIVVVEKDWSIEEVSNLVTDNMRSQIEADFIIVENERYLGLGNVLDLLKKITDLQIKNARYANPLTLLPGNVPIYECLDRLIEDQEDFCVAYCDIDNFKPYNDVYGYGEGDKIIKLIAEILREEVETEKDFIGHVGGDDFIIIFSSDTWRERCEKILDAFSSRIDRFYSEEDKNRGGIYSISREGDERFFPTMTLSIGVVTPNTKKFVSHHDIANLASQAKHSAKNITGNSLYIDKRIH
ncbi:MAG: bifunctional diguanylate cyclase/phosphodiesterase [Pseudohongiellaceae bacterium]|nr:bifunctional diguanylate cyclase/phosphodiesterase [Pseudohongiellaceae bacterium]